ncbi:MAG: cell surface protein [Prevotella sp.]|nr:cell surface protein [Prevotella sp.]MDY2633747.1 cell surface protein [Prevotella sp.]
MKKYVLPAILLITLFSCNRETEIVSSGINDYYYLPRMKKLRLSTAYTGDNYRWYITREDGTDSLVSTDRTYIFLSAEEKTYSLRFEMDDEGMTFVHRFPVIVMHEEVEYSPYTAKVYEYRPAPGQFVNELPVYEEGDTEADMIKKVEESLTNDVMVSLGGYGGYVTFGFDHTVMNRPGTYDFYIKGNSFYSDIPAYKEKKGGSAEPGIVMVSLDVNVNGLPDDPWYELAGSEYHKPSTARGYSITYHRPSDDHQPVPGFSPMITDTEYIRWTDNRGKSGFMAKNMYHVQDYYPKWLKDDQLTFNGTLLPKNGIDESGIGSYFVLYAYDWGYVDNHPNRFIDLNSFDIDWAVDAEGNRVYLPGVDFIRVYTGVNQDCGWIGETSTEVLRATDLNLKTEQ